MLTMRSWRASWASLFSIFGRIAAGCALSLLAACGGAAGPDQPAAATSTPRPSQPTAVSPAAQPAPSGAGGSVALEVDTGAGSSEFRYAQETLEAPAGSKIKLKLNNRTNAADEVGHNWVLVKPGQESIVLANGIAAGDDNDWLDVDDPSIIAHTRLIEGGQSHTVTFDAPPAGTYTYLCTFPDHYANGEKGTLTIR